MVKGMGVFLKLESGFKSGVKNGQDWDSGTEPATTRSLCGQVQVRRSLQRPAKNFSRVAAQACSGPASLLLCPLPKLTGAISPLIHCPSPAGLIRM